MQSVSFSAMVVSLLDTMNEQKEINLRQALKTWEAKQSTSGFLAAISCVAMAGWIVNFLSSPSQDSAIVMGVLMVIMMAACSRLLACASKVVQLRNELQYAHVRADIIDVEVVEPQRRHHSRQLAEYAGSRF